MEFVIRLRKVYCTIFLVVFLAIPTPFLLASEDEKPTGELSVSVMNQYIYRGYEFSRNSVVIQPSMTIGYGGFSAFILANYDANPYASDDKSYSGTLNEKDFAFSYTKTLGLFNVGGGYSYVSYDALHSDAPFRPDLQEISLTVSLNTLLSPTLAIYKETGHYRYWYFQFGISHVFELSKMISLKLASSASYLLSTDADAGPKFDDTAVATSDKFSNFHDGSMSINLPVKITDQITITPNLAYLFPLTRDAKNEIKAVSLKGSATPAERDSSFIVGGITASLTF